jgi:uncharacterized protein YmfQ (DUF2313 family)
MSYTPLSRHYSVLKQLFPLALAGDLDVDLDIEGLALDRAEDCARRLHQELFPDTSSSIDPIVFPIGGVPWVQKTSAVENWQVVKMSATGQYQAAVADTCWGVSSDFGATWSVRSSSQLEDISISDDGSLEFLVQYGDSSSYFSTDHGVNFTARGRIGSFDNHITSCSMSIDGEYLLATSVEGPFKSADFGASWTPVTLTGFTSVRGCDVSQDGSIQALTDHGGYIWISRDHGATWTQKATVRNWQLIKMSPSGQYMLAGNGEIYFVGSGSQIFVSSDCGDTWTPIVSSPTSNWTGFAVSSDGKTMMASQDRGYIWMSIDYGVTWVADSASGNTVWRGCAMSKDATKRTAGVYGGYLYTSVVNMPPNSNLGALASWERTYGIIGDPTTSDQQRAGVVVAKMRNLAGLNRSAFYRIARALGYNTYPSAVDPHIQILDGIYLPFRVGIGMVGDPVYFGDSGYSIFSVYVKGTGVASDSVLQALFNAQKRPSCEFVFQDI